MDTIIQSQVFFFISSVGFIILGILIAIILIFVLGAVRSFNNILKKVEKDIDSIGDTTKEMLEEIKDSSVFRFLFKKSKHKKTNVKG